MGVNMHYACTCLLTWSMKPYIMTLFHIAVGSAIYLNL